MSKVDNILLEIEEHESAITVLFDELNVARANQFITCSHCNVRSKVNKWTLLSKFYYHRTNAGAGSYWDFYCYYLYCSKCSVMAVATNLKGFVEKRKSLFKEHLEWYPATTDSDTWDELLVQLRKKQNN